MRPAKAPSVPLGGATPPPIPALGCGTFEGPPLLYALRKTCDGVPEPEVRRKRDGTVAVYDRMKYICINKNAFEPCTGQRNYSARRIDQLILEAVGRMLFSDAFKIPSMDENSALSRCRQLAQELV